MTNIYHYLKVAASGRVPARVKIFGLWAMLVGRRRIAGIFFDPVMACNLRCKMCYMSDAEGRKQMRGQMADNEFIQRLKRALYPWALKLQVGCATEPTLYPNLVKIIAEAKSAGVPYIALTTNGKLIARGNVDLRSLVEAGLNELTLSIHGTSKMVYEELMPGAKFEELLALTECIAKVKKEFPDFKLRVNYTINSLNIRDLEADKFWSLWKPGGEPDIVQLRPVQNMGNTAWQDFDLTPLKELYDSTIGAVCRRCAERNIACIAPLLEQIDEVATDQDFTSALIKEITYCYVSPDSIYAPDFGPEDTFRTYHRRRYTARKLFRAIFSRHRQSSHRKSTKALNYRVR